MGGFHQVYDDGLIHNTFYIEKGERKRERENFKKNVNFIHIIYTTLTFFLITKTTTTIHITTIYYYYYYYLLTYLLTYLPHHHT